MTNILLRLWEFAAPDSNAIIIKMENLFQILKIFKEKVIVIANVFWNLQTLKVLVKPLCKRLRFRTSFDSQHVKGSQTLVKSA